MGRTQRLGCTVEGFLEFQEPEDSAADDRTELKGDIATTNSTATTSTSERKNNNVVLVILTNAIIPLTHEFWTQAMKRLGRASPNPGAAGDGEAAAASSS